MPIKRSKRVVKSLGDCKPVWAAIKRVRDYDRTDDELQALMEKVEDAFVTFECEWMDHSLTYHGDNSSPRARRRIMALYKGGGPANQ